MRLYRSPYEAYPFLCDESADLRCDFELLTDLIASEIGLLRAKVNQKELKVELLRVSELVYHANPSLRTKFMVTTEEIAWLCARTEQYQAEYHTARFVLTVGCEAACEAHLLRVRSKMLVRLLYRYLQGGGAVSNELLDFCNLLSGYFFGLALCLNHEERETEIEFVSRNY